MKKLILLLLIPLFSLGQDYLVFLGDKSYQSSVGFIFDNQYDDVNLSFVKTEQGTAVYLNTFYLYDENAKIRKQLSLFLDNGDVIKSERAYKTDYVDKHCISLYLITENDVSKLKQHNLIRIRYTISDSYEGEINRSARNDEFTGDALKDF